jgi:hypothetical protein
VLEAISLPRSYSPALMVGRSDSMHADGLFMSSPTTSIRTTIDATFTCLKSVADAGANHVASTNS